MNDEDKRFFAEAHITPEEIQPERRKRRPEPDYIVTAEDDVQWLAETVQAQAMHIRALMIDAEADHSTIKMWRALAIIATVCGVACWWVVRH